jgi:ribose transport system substrate-binding protein
MKRFRVAVLLAAGLLAGCDLPSEWPRFAFISNNPAEFWTIARAGTAAAVDEFKKKGINIEVEFYMPANGTAAEQHRIIENLVCKGVKGIALSPNDAANQSRVLNRIIPADVPFITQDSDLPSTSKTRRCCYLGTDNIKAGWAVGKLVKEALPEGGKIMIYVGMLDAQNAQERRLGMIAALAGLPEKDAGNEEARRLAEQSTFSVGPKGKYIILGTMTDEVNPSKCKKNAEDTLVKYPDVKCLVGLWAYNPPALLKAVLDQKKQGKVKIVGFDEDELTLQGIKKGHIYATVVQDPYRFGLEAVRILVHLHRYGQLPEPRAGVEKRETSYYVRHRVIRRKQDVRDGQLFDEDVEAFHEDLKRKKR